MSMAIAAVIAFGFTLLLMYAVLKKYTYPNVEQPFFSDPTLFGLFAVGLVAGTVIFAVYTYFVDSWSNVIVAVIFALILELVKLIVLNLKRFHGKSDTIFYGFGLGLGIGCTMAFGMMFYISTISDEVLGQDISSWLILAVIAFTYILLHSSTGTTIGEGIARKRPWEFLMQALLIDMVVQLILAVFFRSAGSSLWISYALLAAALAASVLYFLRINYLKLPGVVKDVLRMEGKKRDDIKEI